MLEIEFGGKTVTTTQEKQTMMINNNPVEIERVGNSIYVNQMPINLIVPTKKPVKINWFLIGLGLLVVVGGYFASTNQEATMSGLNSTVDYIQSDVVPAVGGLIDGVISNDD